jgi:hypothetical protein
MLYWKMLQKTPSASLPAGAADLQALLLLRAEDAIAGVLRAGVGRIAGPEKEAPILLVNLV